MLFLERVTTNERRNDEEFRLTCLCESGTVEPSFICVRYVRSSLCIWTCGVDEAIWQCSWHLSGLNLQQNKFELEHNIIYVWYVCRIYTTFRRANTVAFVVLRWVTSINLLNCYGKYWWKIKLLTFYETFFINFLLIQCRVSGTIAMQYFVTEKLVMVAGSDNMYLRNSIRYCIFGVWLTKSNSKVIIQLCY